MGVPGQAERAPERVELAVEAKTAKNKATEEDVAKATEAPLQENAPIVSVVASATTAAPVPGVEVSTHSLNFEEVQATHTKAQRTPFHPLRASRVEAPGGVGRRVVPAACIKTKPSARPSGAPANT